MKEGEAQQGKDRSSRRWISRTSIFECFRAGSIYSSLKAKDRSKKGSQKDWRKEEKSKEGKEAKVKEEVI